MVSVAPHVIAHDVVVDHEAGAFGLGAENLEQPPSAEARVTGTDASGAGPPFRPPSVTLAVCTYRRPELYAKFAQSMSELEVPSDNDFRLIVADNNKENQREAYIGFAGCPSLPLAVRTRALTRLFERLQQGVISRAASAGRGHRLRR